MAFALHISEVSKTSQVFGGREGKAVADRDKVRVAALGDLHCGRTPASSLEPLFSQIAHEADILVLCGDLTDHGLPEEALALTKVLTGSLKLPIVTVLGNHDYHSGHVAEVEKILTDAGITVLDGEACEVHGVGFAGVKGFLGGFGRMTLEPWGEDLVKQVVNEAVNETLKLGSALAKLRTKQRVAVLHYAPIPETVHGEPQEIWPYLGCSRLAEPLSRFQVALAFHGHAHRGQAEGRFVDIPIYNVALPLMQRDHPNRPFRVVELSGPEVPEPVIGQAKKKG
jgi:Icc-related predicted phosphoesterase